jgi:phenylacetate-CoA ligase
VEQIREEQLNKIRALLNHAYRHVPYYRDLFKRIGAYPEDIQSFEQYSKLPVLTKGIIRSNSDKMLSDNAGFADRIANATGGSTGEPLQFFQDRRYLNSADAARAWGWYHMAGCRPGDLSAILWGAVRDVKTDFTLAERLRDILKLGEIPLNAFNLSEDRVRYFLKWCTAFRPKILRGYVSAVKEFASYVERNQAQLKGLKAVILCAEAVDEKTQSYIEDVFKTRSYNSYGGRELSLIAMQCEASSELHEVSLNNYVEFADFPDKHSLDAKTLIITNLNNYTMPFLRYEIGDLGLPGTPAPCECGRGFPRIKSIIGRTTEILTFGDGTKIAGEMFIHMMKELSLGEYQFVQIAPDRLALRTVMEISATQKESICRLYGPFLPSGVMMDFEQVPALAKTSSGKFRFVFSEMSKSREPS